MLSSRFFDLLSLALLIVGGLNWGFVSILGYDPLGPVLGGYNSIPTKIIYAAIGLSALWIFYSYMMTPGEDIERMS